MAVLIPRFSGAKEEWIWVKVGQRWARCGELGNIAFDELHLQGAKIVGVGHLVRVLNN
jgi:hypothetical protein